MTEKDVKSCFSIKKLISTSEWCAEDLFAGQNTQQSGKQCQALKQFRGMPHQSKTYI